MAERRKTDQTCLRCAAHHAATPHEEHLRSILGARHQGGEAYVPRAVDPDQRYADQALASALAIYVDAYGLRNAAARLGAALRAIERSQRFEALTQQTLESRRDG